MPQNCVCNVNCNQPQTPARAVRVAAALSRHLAATRREIRFVLAKDEVPTQRPALLKMM